ncbi:Protein of unknown function [Cotesia congregata]|uniref:Uncharacterized protein n=1 Tax=Cotesia congregata TaxID=51543 RepID=A0A8J2MRN7_COTCN|nr:Protein of unknown function [Cotesia congregata]
MAQYDLIDALKTLVDTIGRYYIAASYADLLGLQLIDQQRKRYSRDLKNAFAGNIQTGCVINQRHEDPASFLQNSRDIIINKVQSVLRDLAGLKVNVEFFCTFQKPHEDVEERKSFVTKSREILPPTSLQD